MSFIWPWLLFSLLLIPVFVWIYWRLQRQRQQTTADLGPLGVFQDQGGRSMGRRRHLPALFYLIGLTFILISLARPEMPVKLPRVEGTVILAFDVSSSMAADDLEPTRMEAAKTAARLFVENQPSTILIGVVAFSNGGLVVQPPTDDQTAVLATIERLSPQGATSLGQGIFSSLNAIAGEALALEETGIDGESQPFKIDDYSSAVILLLTDGENTEAPDPLEIAQLAANAGVRIYPVGIGSADGTVLEIDGFNIVTQLDKSTLQQIAGVTNGVYFQAEDEEALQEIYESIDLQLTIAGEMMEVTALIAGISLLFFLIGGALSLLWFGRLP